jgi:hypothetical protein
MSQKIELFLTTAVRKSHAKLCYTVIAFVYLLSGLLYRISIIVIITYSEQVSISGSLTWLYELKPDKSDNIL